MEEIEVTHIFDMVVLQLVCQPLLVFSRHLGIAKEFQSPEEFLAKVDVHVGNVVDLLFKFLLFQLLLGLANRFILELGQVCLGEWSDLNTVKELSKLGGALC